MYCVQCGNKLQETDNYCSGCGSPVLHSPEHAESIQVADTKNLEKKNPTNDAFMKSGSGQTTNGLNRSQGLGMLVAAVIAMAILILHNPTRGYSTLECDYDARRDADPTGRLEAQIDERRELDYLLRVQACADKKQHTYWVTKPFSEWRSVGAFLKPMASPSVVILTLTGIIIAAGIWVRIFRDK